MIIITINDPWADIGKPVDLLTISYIGIGFGQYSIQECNIYKISLKYITDRNQRLGLIFFNWVGQIMPLLLL